MSIISELNKTKDYLRSSRNAVLARGGEISPTAGLKDLPNAIYNIPADSSLAFPSDDTVAYRKIVPVGAEQMARVTTLGGMTYKCNNLIPYPYIEGSSLTNNGVTYTVNADGSIKAVGTSPSDKDSRYELCRELPISSGKTYTVSCEGLNNQAYIAFQRYVNGSWSANLALCYGTPITVTLEDVEGATYRIGLYIKRGETIDLTVRVMLNYGTTALPYEPYFEGLRSAKVTSLKSEGANLIPFPYAQTSITQKGLTATANNDGSIHLSGTATEVGKFSGFFLGINSLRDFTLPKGTYSAPIFGKSNTYQIVVTFANADKASIGRVHSTAGSNTATITEEARHLHLEIRYEIASVGEEVDITYYPMLNYGSTPAPFTPYRAEPIDTLAIPEAVQSLEGYGLGVNSEYFNYIDYSRKVFVQRVGQVDLGSLNWLYRENNGRNIFETNSLTTLRPYQSQTEIFPALSADYRSVSLSATWVDHDMAYFSTREDSRGFAIVDNQYTNPETFTNAVTGKILVYALAEPIETDISAYLTSDGFFKVQGGGTVVAENEYEYAVPSKINYVQKVGI